MRPGTAVAIETDLTRLPRPYRYVCIISAISGLAGFLGGIVLRASETFRAFLLALAQDRARTPEAVDWDVFFDQLANRGISYGVILMFASWSGWLLARHWNRLSLPHPAAPRFLVFATLGIGILTLPVFGYPLNAALDSSWQYALNHFWQTGAQFGGDTFFTYGPLGFFMYPMQVGAGFYLAVLFRIALKLALIGSLLHLHLKAKAPKSMKQSVSAIVVIFLVSALLNYSPLAFQMHYLFLILALLIIHFITDKSPALWLAVGLGSLPLLISTSMALSCYSIMGMYALVRLASDRNFSSIVLISVGLMIGFPVAWLLAGQQLGNIWPFILRSYQLTAGYSEAMGLAAGNSWVLLIIAVGAFIAVPLKAKNRMVVLIFFVTLGASLMVWKHSFTRQDNSHYYIFSIYMLILYGLVWLASRNIKPATWLAMLISVMAFESNMVLAGHTDRFTRLPDMVVLKVLGGIHNGFSNLALTVARTANLSSSLKEQSHANLAERRLTGRAYQQLRGRTVDIYPWKISYIPANDFNWLHRPLMQSYTSYTPELDALNAKHFASAKGPEFILWHSARYTIHASADEDYRGIDNRYLLNDEPLSIIEIMRHYDAIHFDPVNRMTILQRTDHPLLNEPEVSDTLELELNRWIVTPGHPTDTILRAKVFLEKSGLGRLRVLFSKPPPLAVEYRHASALIERFRLVPAQAPSGIWISPLMRVMDPAVTPDPVSAFRIVDDAHVYRDRAALVWETIAPARLVD